MRFAVAAALVGLLFARVAQAETGVGQCTKYAFAHITIATDTQLVAPLAGKQVHLCDFEASEASAGVNFYFEGTSGGSCVGGSQIGVLWTWVANESKDAKNTVFRGQASGIGNGLCVNTSSGTIDIGVFYNQDAIQ